MSSTTETRADSRGSIVEKNTQRLLRESDRINLNQHGLVELDDDNPGDPITMTLDQLRSLVTVVEETKGYEEGVEPIPRSD